MYDEFELDDLILSEGLADDADEDELESELEGEDEDEDAVVPGLDEEEEELL